MQLVQQSSWFSSVMRKMQRSKCLPLQMVDMVLQKALGGGLCLALKPDSRQCAVTARHGHAPLGRKQSCMLWHCLSAAVYHAHSGLMHAVSGHPVCLLPRIVTKYSSFYVLQAQSNVVQQFRRGETNVLFATNIGSEGMDFKQCQVNYTLCITL